MRRKNPFLAKPKYLGQSARLKSWEGGFHTAKTFDFAVPYAQLKWKTSPLGGTDAPVILELDMTGLRAFADIDSRRACLHVVTHAVEGFNGEAESVDELPVEELFEVWQSDAEFNETEPPDSVDRGDSAQNAMFTFASASSDWLSVIMAQRSIRTLEDFTAFLSIFLRLYKNETASLTEEEDAFLIDVFEQAVYWSDVDDARLIAVHYMQPYFDVVVHEEELEDDFDGGEADSESGSLRDYLDLGYDFITTSDFNLRPSTRKVWRRPEPEAPLFGGLSDRSWERPKIEYHGTSLSNLLIALPWLAEQLPKPRRPYDGPSLPVLMRRIEKALSEA